MQIFKRHHNLKTEFIINSLITSTLLFVIVIGVIIALNISMQLNEIHFKNGLLAESLNVQVDEHSENQITVLKHFTHYYNTTDLNDQNEINAQLKTILELDAMFLKIDIINQDGIIVNTTSDDKSSLGLDSSSQPYLSAVHEPGDYYYSNTIFSKEYDRVLASLTYKSENDYLVAYLDLSHLTKHIDRLPIKNELEYMLLDHNGTIVSSSLQALVDSRSKISFFDTSWSYNDKYEYIHINNTKYLKNSSISDLMSWTIIILHNSKDISRPIYNMVAISLAISISMIILITIFQYKRINYIISKIEELNSNLKLIENGVYDVVFSDTQFNEFNELANHFLKSTDEIQERELEITTLNANLESIVETRTFELTEKNDELKALITELEDTQSLLIESEKLASFSRLIAGIAHEINTPVGVCITMSSYLLESSKNLNKAFEGNQLTKGQFKDYIEKLLEISDLLLENLLKAGDLITSFKKASNNNFTYDLCEYNLHDLANNLLKSIETQLKDKHYEILIDIPKDFMLISYPSAMSQILTNLISNAIDHGFRDRDYGQIRINAGHNIAGHIELTVTDDGHGIADDKKQNIFEPFYTTNRDKGGMGLGLSIIHNLVINKLHGSIDIESIAGEYTKFILTLPSKNNLI